VSKQVIIIGGGIIGLTTACYCLRAGHQVTLVERGSPDHDCCARGNAGMIVPSHFVPLAAPGMVAYGLRMMANPRSPFHIKPRLDWRLADWGMNFVRAATAGHVEAAGPLMRDLSLASRALLIDLNREKGFSFGLRQNGLLMLCRTESALREESETAEQANALGIPAETLSIDETAALDPDLNMDIAGSVYFPQDCHLDPARLLAAMTDFIRDHGGNFLWNRDVTAWKLRNGRINGAISKAGDIEGDEYILTGGAYSPELATQLDLHLPMQAGKGYSLTLPKPPQLPKICSILTEARVAVTPIGKDLRFGGTMEIAGLDKAVNPARVDGIIDSARRYFPAFQDTDFSGLKTWSGLRPCSPDGLPYIGRTHQAKNLIIATGHAMLGLSLAPITGKIVSDLVENKEHRFPSPLLSPDRYQGF
jgi:D-amino-acid dehydrogenase